MSDNKLPFNSIGQIIEGGGLRSVAVILSHGGDERRATEFLARNWSGIPQHAADEVIRRARVASEAGQKLTALLNMRRAGQRERTGLEETPQPLINEPISFSLTRDERGRFVRTIEFGDNAAIDIGEIPIEPDLFGSESGGARIDMSIDILRPDGSRLMRIDTELVGDETLDDLLDEMPAYLRHWQDTSPDSFSKAAQEKLDNLLLELTYVARKY